VSQVDDHVEKKRFDKVEALCARALQLDPFSAPALLTQARLVQLRGKGGDVHDLLSRAVRDEPTAPEAHYALAAFLASQGDRQRALELLGRAIELNARRAGLGGYHQRALEDPAFGALRADPELLVLCDPLPSEVPLRRIYELLQAGRHFDAYQAGLQLAGSEHHDAALDAVEAALEAIVSDLQEHGDANLESYGGGSHDCGFFLLELERIRSLRQGRPRSEAFERFSRLR
jgi:tetratricopeptide (TPR) repeat protein